MNTTPAGDLTRGIEQQLRASGLWERSGSVFFSTRDTLRPGLFYFLGLNPGGKPDDGNADEQIGKNVFPRSGMNAFYEKWDAAVEPGEHSFQRNVKCFLGSLQEMDARYAGSQPDAFIQSICSSNIYFVRTATFKSAKNHGVFWKIHERILNDVVRPSCILINGITGYRLMKARLAGMVEKDVIPTGVFVRGREQVVHFATFGADKLLAGIPHLSPRRPYHKATAANNPVWIDEGLPELLARCERIVKKRPADGCAWTITATRS